MNKGARTCPYNTGSRKTISFFYVLRLLLLLLNILIWTTHYLSVYVLSCIFCSMFCSIFFDLCFIFYVLFYVLSFMFYFLSSIYVLCFIFYLLSSMFYLLCFIFSLLYLLSSMGRLSWKKCECFLHPQNSFSHTTIEKTWNIAIWTTFIVFYVVVLGTWHTCSHLLSFHEKEQPGYSV